jgi:hypothetical protein
MANLKSNVQFDGFNLNLNLLKTQATQDVQLWEDEDYEYNGKTYKDIVEFIYQNDGYF